MVNPSSVGEVTVSPSPYVASRSRAALFRSITWTSRLAGSTIQYSLTSCLAYSSRLYPQSRRALEGERISTIRSGAPRMLAGVLMCSRSLEMNSRSG